MSQGPFYPQGTYACRVTNQAWQESKERKLPMLVLRVTPEHIETTRTNAAGDVERDFQPVSKQYARTVRLVIDTDSERSVDFAMKKLQNAGFLGTRFRDLALEGKVIRCTCEHTVYNNRDVEQWDFELPPREEDELENNDAVARKLDAILGKKLKAAAPKATASAPARDTTPSDDGDPLGGAFDPPTAPPPAKPAATDGW